MYVHMQTAFWLIKEKDHAYKELYGNTLQIGLFISTW